MKTLIIVFSQSGFTRQAAERIMEGLISEGSECHIIDLAAFEKKMLSEYDLVGLGCPVYYYQEPFHVRDFIEDLPDLTGKHWFVFCSHCSVMGITLQSMSEGLKKKGAVIVGYYHTYAGVCTPFAALPHFTDGHPDEIGIEEARAFGRELAKRTPLIARGETDLIPECEPVDEQWINEAAMITHEAVKIIVPPFTINKDTCIKCHKCEEVCPVNGYDIEADPPRIQDPCIGCTYCVMACPTCSIEADWSLMAAYNPEHYAKLRIWLEKLAAKGEFRWHMDPDTVDFDDIMIFKHKRKIMENKSGIENTQDES